MTDFSGFPRAGIDFLSDLAADNDKAWFEANRKTYERALKQPMVGLVEALGERLEAFAPEYRAVPAKAISRLHRDTRFSADKSPFKTEISAVFPRHGAPKEEVAGFFFSLSPRGVRVVGGSFLPGPPQLAALQAAWAGDPEEFRRIVRDPTLVEAMGELQGERYQRVPRGYPADHPAADLLRAKQAYFEAWLPPGLAEEPRLADELAERFRRLTPFVRYLDRALAGSRPVS